jgi:hypothetical protein
MYQGSAPQAPSGKGCGPADRHQQRLCGHRALSFLTTECTENTEEDGELAYPESIKSLVLLKPISSGKADTVFGYRFIASHKHRMPYFWHSLGNQFLTLTHMEAC